MAAPDSFVLLLDFGCTFSGALIRLVRELGVRCELQAIESFKGLPEPAPAGVLLCGGTESVFDADVVHLDMSLFDACKAKGVPVLGISYGMMVACKAFGGKVVKGRETEYKVVDFTLGAADVLFEGLPQVFKVHANTNDELHALPAGFKALGTAAGLEGVVAAVHPDHKLWVVYFHPESSDSEHGHALLSNFLYKVCKCDKSWTMELYYESEMKKIKEQCGSDKVVVAGLSGGVDSTVCAAMVHSVIGNRFHGIMVNTGLMRFNETNCCFKRLTNEIPGLQVTIRDSSAVFFRELAGVTDPEQKRKIIGRVYIEEFDAAIKELGFSPANCLLLQGTIYPDILESELNRRNKLPVKSHHNVGGLPDKLDYELIEPVRYLFKEEVRALGRLLKLSDYTCTRPPFPGPGLGVRVIGELTPERVEVVRQADKITRDEIEKAGVKVSQALCVFLPTIRSTGIVHGKRVHGHTVVLRIINTVDFVTAKWAKLDHDLLERISTRITSEVAGVNRVCLDITNKGPATIEWE